MGSPLSLNFTMYVMSSGGACTPLGCGSSHVTTREEGHSGVMERIVTGTVGDLVNVCPCSRLLKLLAPPPVTAATLTLYTVYDSRPLIWYVKLSGGKIDVFILPPPINMMM